MGEEFVMAKTEIREQQEAIGECTDVPFPREPEDDYEPTIIRGRE